MKNIYSISFMLIFSLFFFAGCSKDILKKYDKRIIGTWRISDVDRFGLGGSLDNLAFTEGQFTFFEDGTLTYVNPSNTSFQGKWDIIKKNINDEVLHGLKITAVDFTGTNFLSEYYDDMNFVSTNHFRATIISGLHSYVTSFRR